MIFGTWLLGVITLFHIGKHVKSMFNVFKTIRRKYNRGLDTHLSISSFLRNEYKDLFVSFNLNLRYLSGYSIIVIEIKFFSKSFLCSNGSVANQIISWLLVLKQDDSQSFVHEGILKWELKSILIDSLNCILKDIGYLFNQYIIFIVQTKV